MLDLAMPVMDGRTFRQRIRRDVGLETPVVIVSALVERRDIDAPAALPKPFDPLDLVAKVDRLIHAG